MFRELFEEIESHTANDLLSQLKDVGFVVIDHGNIEDIARDEAREAWELLQGDDPGEAADYLSTMFNVVFDEKQQESQRADEVNVAARLAADDLISSFKEAYEAWRKAHGGRLGSENLNLALRMVAKETVPKVFGEKLRYI